MRKRAPYQDIVSIRVLRTLMHSIQKVRRWLWFRIHVMGDLWFLFFSFLRLTREKSGMYLVCLRWTMHLEIFQTGNYGLDTGIMGWYFCILTHYSPTCPLFDHLLCGRTVGYECPSRVDIINEVPFFGLKENCVLRVYLLSQVILHTYK